jgi:hypothetical protein
MMFSLVLAVMLITGVYATPRRNMDQNRANNPVAVRNVDNVPPPAPPETDVTVSPVE